MTSTTTHGSRLPTEQLRDFFDRLAAGDYHSLTKELRITGKPAYRPSAILNDSFRVEDADTSGDIQDPNASIRSVDSVDSFKFKPTVEGLHRAMSLIRGDEPGREGALTPEEDEAFQFTFRLMIHKLYSIKDFAQMVDDVVRSSRNNYQSLPADLVPRARRPSVAFSFTGLSDGADGESFADLPSSPTSLSETNSVFPSSDSSWTFDRLSSPQLEDDSEGRAVKKRIVGRKFSVVDGAADEANAGLSWVYDSAVASVESTTAFFEPEDFSPRKASFSSGGGYDGVTDDSMEYGARKRRLSFLGTRNV
ncbi:hypothetical protein GSI_13039 [Ganoderma sinense ZZ0214-1]|uniref:Uncharacterized protein n=1 Tax=Ganoderma sinense ZZ0214-1 TaxID=1077348 RepID=A0A2G8RUG1_9APHY|nr:hypothetical protein GSI_13039 [Ganoderma sinense ZZ0214-1]